MTQEQDAAAAPLSQGGAVGPGPASVSAPGPRADVRPQGATTSFHLQAPARADAPGAVTASGGQSGTGWPAASDSAEPSAPTPASSIWTRSADSGQSAAGSAEPGDDEPFARVDAKKLEAALLGLRHPIVTVPLAFETPGISEVRAERVKLLSQIDDYLLPRLRQSGAPILVALVGSTGAGKSTLMNSVVGRQVSATGIRRPTTNSPVLACHPDDMRWFAENVFLPTMPRVRQQGLAMPGRDGLLVLAASEGMPQGVAVLDTPDIDSVVKAHHEFAHQFLDASDLWLFVTTARRYADAAVWDMLKDARDRGAALAIALSRVPAGAGSELIAHFEAMLEVNGLRDVRRFIIPETVITDAQLPAAVAAPVKDWLADTARRDDRRVAVLTQTMSGVLDTFRDRVPGLAGQVAEQLVLRDQLRDIVETAYTSGLAGLDEATADGSLLYGEVLARWQDFAGTGDVLRTLQVRRGRGGRQKRQRMPARAAALRDALTTSMVSLITATAARAAEQVVAGWLQHPAGAALLAALAPDRASAGDSGPTEAEFVATALADLGLVSQPGPDADSQDVAALARVTSRLAAGAASVVAAWQDRIRQIVSAEKVTKRSVARVLSFDEDSLALVLTIGVLGVAADTGASASEFDRRSASEFARVNSSDSSQSRDSAESSRSRDAEDGSAVAQRLLEALFGAGLLRDMGARIRLDLRDRVGQLLSDEALRFFAIVDSPGVPDESAADDLLAAGQTLEDAR